MTVKHSWLRVGSANGKSVGRRMLVMGAAAAVGFAGSVVVGSTSAIAATVVTTGSDLEHAFGVGGAVTLGADITINDGNSPLVGSGVALDLAGHNLIISNVNILAGIEVPQNTSLTINDTSSGGGGTLTVTGGAASAGIGGRNLGDSGPVTVTGGLVIATGGSGGAGIGGGDGGDGGSVVVSGGSVTATGGLNAAGIGGGAQGAAGDTTVMAGGSLTAIGGSGEQAIGAGLFGLSLGTLSNAGSLTFPNGSTESVSDALTVANSGTIHLAGSLSGNNKTMHNTGVILVSGAGSVENHGQGGTGHLTIDTNNYALSFDVNGGSSAIPPTQYVYADTVAHGGQALPGASGPGLTFTGWFTAASGGTQVTGSTSLPALFGAGPAVVTLHAHYTSSGSPQPVVTAVSPSSGPPAGGTSVAISGTGFTGASSVKFGGTKAASFIVNSATKITVVSPAHELGAVNVFVTTTGGTSATVSADRFAYKPPPPVPTVTGVSPTVGSTAGGTLVTITGTGFAGATTVKFGGTTAPSFTVSSDAKITVTSPAHSAGAVNIFVITPGGTSVAVTGDQFKYKA